MTHGGAKPDGLVFFSESSFAASKPYFLFGQELQQMAALLGGVMGLGCLNVFTLGRERSERRQKGKERKPQLHWRDVR